MGPSRNASCAFYHVLNEATYGHEKEQKKYSKTNESTVYKNEKVEEKMIISQCQK